jgi:exopolysaccharide production protein ExoQ
MHPLFPKSLINKLEIAVITLILFSVSGIHTPPRWLSFLLSLVFTVFSLVVLTRHWKRMAALLTKDWLLYCFIAMAIASLLWSSSPDTTNYDLKYLIRGAIFSTYLSIRYSSKGLIQVLLWATGTAMLLSVGFGLLFPAYSLQQDGTAWIGIFGHKQGVGSYMGLTITLFLVSIFDQQRYRWLAVMGLALAFVLVLLSESKAGLVLCSFSFLLTPLYKISKQGKYRGVLMMIALILSCVVAALVIINLEAIVVGWLGKNLEFNGRLPIWILAIGKGLEQPWLGYGYHGFWTSDASDTILFNTWIGLEKGFKLRDAIPNAHQGFIDLFLQLGLVGIALFFTSFIVVLKRATDLLLLTRAVEYFWMLLFLAYFLIINLVESGVILEQSIAWIIYSSVSLSSAIEYRQFRKARCASSEPVLSSASA